MRPLRRLPIRLRLTLAFATAMAIAFAAVGYFIYADFRRDLTDTLDQGLRERLHDVETLAAEERVDTQRLVERDRRAELYQRDGSLIASSPDLLDRRLLSVAEVREAAHHALVIKRRHTPIGDVRIRGGPARGAVAAVAEPLKTSDHELSRLGLLLLVAGPLALILASFAGHEVAEAALRPVERMRENARSITERNLAERLPVPETDDEIARLGETLNELLERLEEALARERRVVSDASHELRTPLTLMRTELELALRGERDKAELRAAIEAALAATGRLSRLADDLLVLARADQGRLPLRPEPLDAQDLIEQAAARLAPAASEAGRPVRTAVEVDGGAVLFADPDRTAQAVDNLAFNALRHGAGAIVLTARAANGMVELHVTDEGAGFADGFEQHAFERFSGEGGSGLGLAIVEAIARASDGRAGARNRPEGGVDAWIALPAA